MQQNSPTHHLLTTIVLAVVCVTGCASQQISSRTERRKSNQKTTTLSTQRAVHPRPHKSQTPSRCSAPKTGTKGLEDSSAKSRAELKAAQQAAKSNNVFGLKIMRKLVSKKASKNVFISPYSLMTALSMTMAGMGGRTLQQMEKLLDVHGSEKQHHKRLSELNAWLAHDRTHHKYQFSVANRIWLSALGFKPTFLNLMKTFYGSGIAQADFLQFKKERKRINRWVEKKTNNMIKELLPKRSLSPSTRMVLTNAIFFKGTWEYSFKKKDTKKLPFYAPGGKEKVMMMSQKGKFKHAYIKGGQVLELPYKGKSTSMVVFLPNKQNKTWKKDWMNVAFLQKEHQLHAGKECSCLASTNGFDFKL